MNLIGVWQTSNPFTVTNSTSTSNTIPGTGDRVNVVADPNLSSKSLSEFFNTAAFATQTPGTLGNEGIMQYFGPHFRHLDLGLTKTFPVTERMNLKFSAQSFNLFNTPNFANPGSTLNGNFFGQITSMLYSHTPRVFQFSLKLNF